MPDFVISIPDLIFDRVLNALCFGDSPSPDKALATLQDMIKTRVIQFEGAVIDQLQTDTLQQAKRATDAQRKQSYDQINQEIVLSKP